MGNLAFNIEKFVDLNKVVTLDIDKTVDVNVNNPDQLATAEADAEAFGIYALAETDAYTYVNKGQGTSTTVTGSTLGAVDALGNTTDLLLEDFLDNGLPGLVTVNFTVQSGDELPDVDDVNGFELLDFLSVPPPNPGDQLPAEEFDVLGDKDLVYVDEVTTTPLEGRYRLDSDWTVNLGNQNIDIDQDGTVGNGDLLLTIPEGSLYLGELLTGGAFELQFERFVPGDDPDYDFGGNGPFNGNGWFTYVQDPSVEETVFPLTGYVQEAESLEIGFISDWDFQAASDFPWSRIEQVPGEGEAFSYAESTAALDLNADGIDVL